MAVNDPKAPAGAALAGGAPPPGEEKLLDRREDFIKTFFRKGAELTEELIAENQRLRYQVVALQGEVTAVKHTGGSESDAAAAVRELARRVGMLEQERENLSRGFAQAQARSEDYEARFREVEEENERLANLYVAADQLHSTLELREVLQIILEIVLNFIGAKQFAIMLVDEGAGRLFPVAAEGMSVSAVPEYPMATGAVGAVLSSGEPFLAPEMNLAAGAAVDLQAPLAVIPLALRVRPVGAIVIYRYLVQKKEIVAIDHALFRLLANHAATSIVGARNASDGGPRPLTRAALVVEDSPLMRQLIVYALKQIRDLKVVEADDGVDALRKLQGERFDIVITDINMPIMDGLKLVRRIRSDEVHKDVPIVIITTEGAEEDRQRALSLGANAYIHKPIRSHQVLTKVKELLRL